VAKVMANQGWRPRFDKPIKLPGGGRLFTLKDGIAWLAKEIPQSEHSMKEVQTAAHCVTELNTPKCVPIPRYCEAR
jgi:hypothetical protein